MRYYQQESGSITIDGIPLEDLNVEWLRSTIGIVSQGPAIFQATETRILLCDEATAALDGESEKLVQEALDRARNGRACLAVYGLSTIQNADLIYTLENGKKYM